MEDFRSDSRLHFRLPGDVMRVCGWFRLSYGQAPLVSRWRHQSASVQKLTDEEPFLAERRADGAARPQRCKGAAASRTSMIGACWAL